MLPSLTSDQLKVVVNVVMRVPGLFIIDYWWQYGLSNSLPDTLDQLSVLNAAINYLVLVHGFLLLLLPISQVKILYTHFVSGGLIVCSHLVSKRYVLMEENASFTTEEKDVSFYKGRIMVLIFHGFLVAAVCHLLNGPWKPFPPALGCYILPILARLADFPLSSLQIVHNVSSAIMAFNIFLYITYQVPNILDFAKSTYFDIAATAETYGIVALLTSLLNKLFVPNHFAVFWLIEFVVKLFILLYRHSESDLSWGDEWYIVILTVVSSICASPVTLVATSVAVSYISFFALISTQTFLNGQLSFRQDNPFHSGWSEGITLVLLSFQTGLPELEMPTRIAVMTIILFIVLSCLLQSMLEIAEPIILALSASRSLNYGRHIRALTLCIALLTFPLYLIYILSQVFPIDIWMMIVLSSCLLTSVQVIDIFIVYCLFLYDSMRVDTWESLDDIVYYTRAITKVLEFLVAVFVVGMGIWEYTTVKWSFVNGLILMVHCYVNVWQRLKNGWQSFLFRREAAKKSESLPSASEEQLLQLDDVCSICFSQMKAACITPCQHYFHRTCIRKWLYVQDKCPLCHSIVSLSMTG